jgi:putative thiamine transport system permease protein
VVTPLRRLIVRPMSALRWARGAGRAAVLGAFALPLATGLVLGLGEAVEPAGWRDLLATPQWRTSLALGVGSALASTALALVLTMLLATALHGTRAWTRLVAALAPMLAVPHAALAIGLAWLLAPAGLLARLLAPLAGWTAPPPWATVNDPHALLLVGVLVLKETPFLLWNLAALLARRDEAARLAQAVAVARCLGYGRAALWWRAWWPLVLPRLAWPLLAVLAYGLTVVDVALVVGPTAPPTLAVAAYLDLLDGGPAANARGAAAALLLGVAGLALVAATALLWRAARRLWRVAGTRGVQRAQPAAARAAPARAAAIALGAAYAAALAVLLALSVAGVWTFPALLPQVFTAEAWSQALVARGSFAFTTLLAALASALALLLAWVWLESTPARWDAAATPLALAPLVLPSLLLMAGLYQGSLHLRLDGTLAGLVWVHVLAVLPYSWLVLRPAWRAFDPRLEHTALALGRSRAAFWWRVKWPLLAPPIGAALAVGFAVSVAQFVATQFVGAGRYATVTTEAVTLASGGQRTLAAAFALLQALLPLAGFALAARLARRGPV